jgi:hypothetical protein
LNRPWRKNRVASESRQRAEGSEQLKPNGFHLTIQAQQSLPAGYYPHVRHFGVMIRMVSATIEQCVSMEQMMQIVWFRTEKVQK